MRVLFSCSRNKWRSRTAETIFKNNSDHQVKSAGTSNEARVKVSEKIIAWADLIFVMERHHKEKFKEKFRSLMDQKRIIVLDIPDEYKYMDDELIEILKTSPSPYLQL